MKGGRRRLSPASRARSPLAASKGDSGRRAPSPSPASGGGRPTGLSPAPPPPAGTEDPAGPPGKAALLSPPLRRQPSAPLAASRGPEGRKEDARKEFGVAALVSPPRVSREKLGGRMGRGSAALASLRSA